VIATIQGPGAVPTIKGQGSPLGHAPRCAGPAQFRRAVAAVSTGLAHFGVHPIRFQLDMFKRTKRMISISTDGTYTPLDWTLLKHMKSLKEAEWRQNVMQAIASGQLAQRITHESGKEYNVAAAYTIVIEENLSPQKLSISDVKNLLSDSVPEKTGSRSDFPILLGKTDAGLVFLDGQHRKADAIKRGDAAIAAYVLSVEQTERCHTSGVNLQDLERLGILHTRKPLKPVSTESITKDIRELIRERAFQLFEERGKGPGRELDDWLQAESEIKDQLGR
jgi:hypothetical protein